MSDSYEAGDSSLAVKPPIGRPDSRTRYEKDRVLDLSTKVPELYKVGQEVYLKGARNKVDHRPYAIHEVLGDGHYELSRDGKSDRKVHLQEDLQTEYPETYRIGDEVFLKGSRGIDPRAYKIHEVHGSGQYEISRDDKCDHRKYPETILSTEP